MIIVFNTSLLLKEMRPEKYFIQELLRRILLNHPEDKFIIITDHALSDLILPRDNITTVIKKSSFTNPLLRKIWFDFKLPAILKKYNADVFVGTDFFCSTRTSVPQCLLLHDLTYFQDSSSIKKSHLFLYKRWLPAFLNRAKAILTILPAFKKELSLDYKISEDKIDVVHTAAKNIFHPLAEEQKEQTKKQHSEGKIFFICSAVDHSHKSLLHLLKAFSVFKKRQKSNWKLLVAGTLSTESKAFQQSLSTYKYREDIILTATITEEERALLMGSAYAMIYSTRWDSIGTGLLEALQCGIPVIAPTDLHIQEIAGDAILYTDFADHLAIADKMMLLYKDETFRTNLIEKGQEAVANFSWDKTAGLVWQSIEKACLKE